MDRLPETATLLLIDVQAGLDEPRFGPRNNPGAEANMARLLGAWRASGRPVVHVKHDSRHPESPLWPGQPGNAIKDVVAPLPGEPVLHKNVNSGFIGTDLEERLRRLGSEALAICGLTTNHCVSTTARMAGNLGFTTIVVSDATATHDGRTPDGRPIPAETMHEVGLAELHGEFATVVDTAALLERL
jgi:nicotinamidase-related amidase